jgi:hypothetical protein
MLYAELRLCCARLMFDLACLPWDDLIALRFVLLSLFLAKLVCLSLVMVMLFSTRNRLSLSHSHRSICPTCCRVLSCIASSVLWGQT